MNAIISIPFKEDIIEHFISELALEKTGQFA